MDLISEWITPGGIVLVIGIILGIIIGQAFSKLWLSTKLFAYRFLPEPIKLYGHWLLVAGIIIFAVVWTVLK